MLSGWVESLGTDRLYAWTSISAPPPCSTVQLGSWAHYRPTLARDYTHMRTHTAIPHILFFPPISLLLSFSPPFFLSHCHILSSYYALPNFFPFSAFFFCPLFSPLSLCHILFSRTQHILPFFFCFCHPFFYFLCFFLFLTYCFLLSCFPLSYSVCCLPFSNSSFLTSSLLLALSLSFSLSSFFLTKSPGTKREGQREWEVRTS